MPQFQINDNWLGDGNESRGCRLVSTLVLYGIDKHACQELEISAQVCKRISLNSIATHREGIGRVYFSRGERLEDLLRNLSRKAFKHIHLYKLIQKPI